MGDLEYLFEELIMEESINICEQLNRYVAKEETNDCIDSSTIKSRKRVSFALWALSLLIVLMVLYFFFTIAFKSVYVYKDFSDTYNYFPIIFPQLYTHRFTLGDAFNKIEINLGLTFLTAMIGGVIALFLRLWGLALHLKSRLKRAHSMITLSN